MKWLPWIMAGMWLAARFVVRQFIGMSVTNAHTFGVLSNVLLIVILVFVALYYKYKTTPGINETFFQDFTTSMRAAMKYVIGAVVAIFLYYVVLQPEDIQYMKQVQLDASIQAIATDEGLAQVKSTNPAWKDMTREMLIEQRKSQIETGLSLKTILLGGMLALTVVSLSYSLLAVFFWRVMMKRK